MWGQYIPINSETRPDCPPLTEPGIHQGNKIKSRLSEWWTWGHRAGCVTALDILPCICCFKLWRRISANGIIPLLLTTTSSTSPWSKSKWLRVVGFPSTINWSGQCERRFRLESEALWKLSTPGYSVKYVEWSVSVRRLCVTRALGSGSHVEPVSCRRGQELLIGWESLAASAGPRASPW